MLATATEFHLGAMNFGDSVQDDMAAFTVTGLAHCLARNFVWFALDARKVMCVLKLYRETSPPRVI